MVGSTDADARGATQLKPNEVPSPTQGREPASELVLERLPARRERPIAIALAVGALLGLLIWAPWRPDPAPLPQRSAIAAASAEPTTSSSAEAVTASAPPLVAPGTFGTRRYVSITDNEWTVVALLTTAGGTSTEEPAIQHETSSAAADGPLAVLQQGVDVVAAPVERPDRPAAVCAVSPVPAIGRPCTCRRAGSSTSGSRFRAWTPEHRWIRWSWAGPARS